MRTILEHWLETIAILCVIAALIVGVVTFIGESTCYEYAHSGLRSIPDGVDSAEYRATLYERCRAERASEQPQPESESP